jgi:hypothetical protein
LFQSFQSQFQAIVIGLDCPQVVGTVEEKISLTNLLHVVVNFSLTVPTT